MTLMKGDRDVFAKSFPVLLGSLDYEMQFFGVGPYFLFEEYKKLMSTKIQSLMDDAEKKLLKISDPAEYDEARTIVARIRNKFVSAIENSSQKAEAKFHAVFEIPPHVLLPEDQIHAKNYTESDVKEADAEIQALEKRYERAVCMETLLKREVVESGSLDILEKKVMELEDKGNVFLNELNVKKESWNQTRNMILELDSLYEQLKSLCC